jgi:hypothetical protein
MQEEINDQIEDYGSDEFTIDVDIEEVDEEKENDWIPFTIRKDVLPVNEVQQMVKVMWTENTVTNGEPNKHFSKCLFVLVCAQACNTITQDFQPERTMHIYELASTEFVKAMETLPKKVYIIENVLQFFPEGKFPDKFMKS